ncbi:MAG: phosphoenolpyruvate--protein phosphotransferase [Bifidobacteriaceae bacterium]|jgi:phosphotransferase system enzyme I (PtsI)|nr:phosphoenolpyruvate--protein phosphotransferase [Bifidobacteriaceae bacterium]
MKEFTGQVASEGLVIGETFVMKAASLEKTAQYENTYETYAEAKEKVKEQLDQLYEKTLAEIGQAEADIIDAQRLMLLDPDFDDAVKDALAVGQTNLVEAVRQTGETFAKVFENMDNDYFKARATDVRDFSNRIIDTIQGTFIDFSQMVDKSVVIGEDITPSQTLSMDQSKIAAFVMSAGSMTGHTSILARTLGIPSIINAGAPILEVPTGLQAIVDGKDGTVIIEPTSEQVDNYQKKFDAIWFERENLEQYRGKPSVTKSGKEIKVYANIGSVGDAEKAFAMDAEGSGLFRSEFVYLGRSTAPSEEEQHDAYLGAARALAKDGKKRPVIIRTLDIGADKNVSYLGLEVEANPALGYRALRIQLDRADIFETQLRALYRTAAEQVIEGVNPSEKPNVLDRHKKFTKKSQIGIMFPMVASHWEVDKALEMCAKVREELKVPEDLLVEVGIMIETPAAAIMADDLAKLVDFFSVGTNDLTQYTLAIDRQGTQKVEKYYDAHHPALLRLLENIAKSANESGIWAGICGELGGDLELTEFFINAGFTELSVAPPKVLELRQKINSLD